METVTTLAGAEIKATLTIKDGEHLITFEPSLPEGFAMGYMIQAGMNFNCRLEVTNPKRIDSAFIIPRSIKAIFTIPHLMLPIFSLKVF